MLPGFASVRRLLEVEQQAVTALVVGCGVLALPLLLWYSIGEGTFTPGNARLLLGQLVEAWLLPCVCGLPVVLAIGAPVYALLERLGLACTLSVLGVGSLPAAAFAATAWPVAGFLRADDLQIVAILWIYGATVALLTHALRRRRATARGLTNRSPPGAASR